MHREWPWRLEDRREAAVIFGNLLAVQAATWAAVAAAIVAGLSEWAVVLVGVVVLLGVGLPVGWRLIAWSDRNARRSDAMVEHDRLSPAARRVHGAMSPFVAGLIRYGARYALLLPALVAGALLLAFAPWIAARLAGG